MPLEINSNTSTKAVLSTALALVVLGLLRRWRSSKKSHSFPPGPKPHWLIGNALDIPYRNASRVYYAWSKEFNSKMIHLSALGTRIIVLNSREDADELFENRSRIYSDRPYIPLELIGWEYNFSVQPYGARWREHRRVAQQHFNASSVKAFYPIFTSKVQNFLIGLLDLPDRFDDHGKTFSRAIPLATMFGYDVKTVDDPAIYAGDGHIDLGVQIMSPGGSLVTVFPWFENVPWTWTQRVSRECKRLGNEMRRIPLEELLRNIAMGTAVPSVVGNFMERKQTVGASPEEEQVVANVAHTVYAGASDTTISATRTFFYLMARHPEIQAKAHEEIDRVIGYPHRVPTIEDRESLPYTEAIYRELLRWCPPVPMGIGHVAQEDDWYKGYFIPKGTYLFANIWAMGMDESKWGPDAHVFKPERFFDEQGNLKEAERILAYGFGKRACVGKYVASSMLWLMMVSILSCYTIGKKKDENGHEIEIDDVMNEEGLMIHKAPFKCDIRPRSDAWREVLETLKGQM